MTTKKSQITKEEFDALKTEAINVVDNSVFVSCRLSNGNQIIYFKQTNNYYLMEVTND